MTHDEKIARIERIIDCKMDEYREEMQKTDAGARSTSRRKSQARRARERSEIWGLCEALHFFTDDRTPTEAYRRAQIRSIERTGES